MSTSTTDQNRWQAGAHELTFDPANQLGTRVVDLYRRIKGIEHRDGSWPSGDATTVLGEWLTEQGFDLEADAPIFAEPGHVFVPYHGSVVLGSAHRNPWLAESFEQATLPVGERPDVTPCFLDLEHTRRWIRWFVAEFPNLGRADEWEIREVAVKKVTCGDRPWAVVFPRNHADWSYQSAATRYPAVAPTREDHDD